METCVASLIYMPNQKTAKFLILYVSIYLKNAMPVGKSFGLDNV